MLSDVQGQDRALARLQSIVDKRSTNALLLVGDEGVGRRFSVAQVAQEFFCRGERTLSCRCPDCTQLAEGIHPDFCRVLPVDDKEIGVEAIRDLIDQTHSFPTMGPLKVLFIDGVDRISMPAANAILKTLEEPPASVRFFLSTESYDQVLPTIRSRCERVAFRNLPESFVVSTLGRFETDTSKALVYARIAEGSVGRAIRFWTENRLKLRDHVLTAIERGLGGDVSSMFAAIDEIGKDALPLSLKFFEHATHDLLIAPLDPARMINVDVAEQVQQMSARGSDATWVRFRAEMKQVHNRFQASHVNLPFHVKTAFVNTFVS